MRKAKMVVAAIGSTATAVATMLATLSVALGDDRVDLGEYSSIATAVATLVATVWAVWRVPNQPAADQARPLRR